MNLAQQANSQRSPHQGRLMLALVAGLLALPFAIAAGLYFGGWKPDGTVHHGQLFEPPAPLPASGLRLASGEPLPTETLHGKWLLALSISGPCQATCLDRIDEARRIQVSLNKEMGRLRRIVLLTQPADAALLAVAARQPDILIATAPPEWLAGGEGSSLHIIDPSGRQVIRYGPTANPRAVRHDLERLLKFAWNG